MNYLVIKLVDFLESVGKLTAYSDQSNYGLVYDQTNLTIFKYGFDEHNHHFSEDIFKGTLLEFKRFGHKFTELEDILPRFKFYNLING